MPPIAAQAALVGPTNSRSADHCFDGARIVCRKFEAEQTGVSKCSRGFAVGGKSITPVQASKYWNAGCTSLVM